MDLGTLRQAASWMTYSIPAQALATASRSRRSARMNSTRSFTPARLSSRPVERSSRTRTWCPSATSRSVTWDPMNPAPPVTRYRTMIRLRCSPVEPAAGRGPAARHVEPGDAALRVLLGAEPRAAALTGELLLEPLAPEALAAEATEKPQGTFPVSDSPGSGSLFPRVFRWERGNRTPHLFTASPRGRTPAAGSRTGCGCRRSPGRAAG